jgi:hypothetical protein
MPTSSVQSSITDSVITPAGGWEHGRANGDRKPDNWRGIHFQVPGLGHQVPGSGFQVRVQVQEICPLSSIQSSIHFGWQVAAPGGGWRVFRPASSTQSSVICPLPSIQSSIQLCRDAVPTLPRQTRAVRGAAPTPRQALPLYSILHTLYSLCISPNRQPLTANHCLT